MSLRVEAGLLALAIAALLAPGCLGIGEASDEKRPVDAGSDADAGSLADGSWICTPKTCKDLGADCGETSDGCGSVVACGACSSGETCGAAGPNRCGVGTCNPLTCAAAGAECGLIGDGCGKPLDCGSCPSPEVCGASGQANKCSCVPTTCAAEGKDCGSIPDGCGGTLSCGSCPTGQKCGAGGTPNVCACEPTTCAAQSASCGSIPDGCGGTLSCGSCKAPSTCGGLGTPNVCGCSPKDCPPVYQNSFETTASFPAGWVTWHNCATDNTWSITRETNPAPNGGSYGLRFHTTGFTPSCQYPGAYAMSPSIPALPGRVYKVQTWSRNGAFAGATTLIFQDSADKDIGSKQISWTTDAWQWSADPLLTATSPTGTATLRVRLELWSPTADADVDLLEVNLEPL